MKQVFIRKGKVSAHNVPEPLVKRGYIKIAVHYSTISSGTELTSVKGSSKSILKRALEDPEKVFKIIDIIKNQGIKNARSKVANATDKLNSIGYSIAGEIVEMGEDVSGFSIGDKVAAGGSGFAVHADFVTVPMNLVVKVPLGLDLMYAATGTVGSIALHGVRRADLRIGEYGVVLGAGLLGLMALQVLKASGVRTACVDINSERLSLAKELGADLIINSVEEDPVLSIQNWTSGYGADAVLFMAATDKDEPLSQAFRMCRRKGRVVLVGVSGMNVNRNDIYRDEIDLLISTSYGPGRYDDSYELKGNDYPYAYVRWTENRNIAAYLELVKNEKINLEKLKPKVYPVDRVGDAYFNIANDPEGHILSIIQFDSAKVGVLGREPAILGGGQKLKINEGKIKIGLIGAGSFASSTLLPIIYENSSKFFLKTVVNSTGDKAVNVALQFDGKNASSDPNDVFNDPDLDLVMICTRHNNHGEMVLRGLKSNKHVFVEKPLAIRMDELEKIRDFYKSIKNITAPILTVGYNRRFSTCATEIKRILDKRTSAAIFRYRMNAGFVAYDSWIHDDGGRIIGEACHIIDLLQFLTGSEVSDYSISNIHSSAGRFKPADNRSIMLAFKDGSIASIDYFSCGSNLLSKEYLEVHFDNKSVVMDDYKILRGYGIKVKNIDSAIPQKGHKEEWMALYNCLKTGQWPIPLESLLHTTEISFLVSK